MVNTAMICSDTILDALTSQGGQAQPEIQGDNIPMTDQDFLESLAIEAPSQVGIKIHERGVAMLAEIHAEIDANKAPLCPMIGGDNVKSLFA